MSDPDLSVVIPAFNEVARLPRTLERVTAFLREGSRSYEVLVADDGSTDETAQKARAAGATVLRDDHNRGKGQFESVGLLSGVAVNAEGRAQAGMGVDAGDYDNDGRLDLVLTTFAQDTKTIYRNLGNALFEDVSRATGLAAPSFEPMGWGVAFFDADLDGRLDLFIANGHIYPNVSDFPELHETFRQKQ